MLVKRVEFNTHELSHVVTLLMATLLLDQWRSHHGLSAPECCYSYAG